MAQWPQGLDYQVREPRGAQGDTQPWGGGGLLGGCRVPPSPGTGTPGPRCMGRAGQPGCWAISNSPTNTPPQKNGHKCQGAELIHLIFPSHLIKSRVTFGKSC